MASANPDDDLNISFGGVTLIPGDPNTPSALGLRLDFEPPNFFIGEMHDGTTTINAIIRPVFTTWNITALMAVEQRRAFEDMMYKQFEEKVKNKTNSDGDTLNINIPGCLQVTVPGHIVSYSFGDFFYSGGTLVQELTLVVKETKIRIGSEFN